MVSLLTMLMASSIDCVRFAETADQPIRVVTRPLLTDDLSWPAPKADAVKTKNIGELEYLGDGVEIRSDDPRFGQLEILGGGILRHPCGYSWNGVSGWDARLPGLSDRTIQFAKVGPFRPTASHYSVLVKQSGVVPQLPGWALGEPWPITRGAGRFYVASMIRADVGDESLIVAFADKKGASLTRELAHVRMRVDDLTITPAMHSGELYLNLEGRMPDGSLRRVELLIPDALVGQLAHDFGL